MKRREAVVAALALHVAGRPERVLAQAGKTDKVKRIAAVPDLGATGSAVHQAFIDTLQEAGKTEGRDFALIRSGLPFGTDWDLLIKRAADENPDLLVAGSTGVVRGFQQLRPMTPVVLWGGGLPVEAGIVNSLAHPGGNVTGITGYGDKTVVGKYLQLLLEVKPGIKRIGVFWDRLPPFFTREETDQVFSLYHDAARALKTSIRIMPLAAPEDVDSAMNVIAAEKMDALVLSIGRPVALRRQALREFALQKRLPTFAELQIRDIDPLLSYGVALPALIRQAAGYVDRILWGGTKPGDLPMQQPTKFELTVNLKMAKAIGLTVPQSLRIRADVVIE